MEGEQKGFILPKKKAVHGGGMEGNTATEFYDFLRRTTEPLVPGTVASKHIKFNLDILSPGGGVEEHYHEPPVVDHVYYVISGRIRATVGNITQTVGADTMIYCPSSTRHAITNIGKGKAKVISIDASAEGVRGGSLVYSRIPSGNLSGNNWKVAGK